MSTRAHITFKEEKKTIGAIFVHWDGYPSNEYGNGIIDRLRSFCGGGKIINGYSDHKIPKHFNGVSCLAAYLVEKFKESKIGNVYLMLKPSGDEDYLYTVSEDKGRIHVKAVKYDGKTVFDDII